MNEAGTDSNETAFNDAIFTNTTQPGWVHRPTELGCSTRMNPRSSRDMDPRNLRPQSPRPSIFFRRDRNPAASPWRLSKASGSRHSQRATRNRPPDGVGVLQPRAQNPGGEGLRGSPLSAGRRPGSAPPLTWSSWQKTNGSAQVGIPTLA